MGKPYELISVPGTEDLRILTVAKSIGMPTEKATGSKTPWWMISIKGTKELLSSTVEGNSIYKNYAELYGFQIDVSREVASDVSNQLFTSAMIKHEDCIVLIPNGGYVAELENLMNSGKPVTKISIQGIGWYDNALKPFTSIVFDDSYIISVTHDLDRAFIRFRVQDKTHTFFVHDQKGKSSGQAMCALKLADNTSTLE
ncbi:MAG: hypothetical protein LBF66_02800 [Holosporales bacterium]|jgi:hypothetical protein|nr:hypothetical protein [Holosporales bacterium]